MKNAPFFNQLKPDLRPDLWAFYESLNRIIKDSRTYLSTKHKNISKKWRGIMSTNEFIELSKDFSC